MMKNNYVRGVGIVLAAVLLTACTKVNAAVVETEATQNVTETVTGQNADAQTDGVVPAESSASGKIRIIHVNDIHSYVEESDTAIGYPRIAAYIEQMKTEEPNTIVLDAGDSFAGTASAAFDRGESLPAILNTIGFDVMAAGNADFSYGLEQLQHLQNALEYPILCGNMPLADGSKVFDGTMKITLANGIRVGIVSVTTPESIRQVAGVFEYQDPFVTCQSLVDEIRPEVDLVIALVHLGDAQAQEKNSDRLAEQVTGIDLIVDGHSHTVLENGKVVNGILITQAGEYSKYIGVIDLEMKDGEVAATHARLITKEEIAAVPEKEDTKTALGELLEKKAAYFSQVIGKTETAIMGERNTIRTQETSAGNLFADAVLAESKADVAIMPSGIIGGDLQPGDITKGDVLNIARVSSTIITKEMKGSDIVMLMNQNVAAYPEPSPSFAQISGFTMTFDPAAGDNRVTEILIDGTPMDLEKIYVVALAIGMTESPGAANGILIEEVGESSEIVERYLEAAGTVAPGVDGRIRVK